jgi:hypothetical protein
VTDNDDGDEVRDWRKEGVVFSRCVGDFRMSFL